MADCSVHEMNSWVGHGLCFQNSCPGVYNISTAGALKCKRVSFVGLEGCSAEKNKGLEGYNNNNNNNNGWIDMTSIDCNGGGIVNKGFKDCNLNVKLVSKGFERTMPIDRSIDEHLQSNKESSLYHDDMGSLIPGLPDDIVKSCMALIPRSDFPAMGCVSKSWKSFIESREFHKLRKDSNTLEEWLYALTVSDDHMKEMSWRVFNPEKNEWKGVASMPGPTKLGSGFAVIDGKLFVIGGVVENGGAVADVLLYDSALNRWKKVASMRTPRYEFACAVLGGFVYVVGGHGIGGKNLTNVEVYDPLNNVWTDLPSLKRARWGCIGSALGGKLYVMGGRSSFTIGHSRCVDVFDPVAKQWQEEKNGCMMVLTHAIVDEELFCIEWKHDRKLAVYNASENSWKRVALPLAGSLNVGFCLANLGGKLLLYPTRGEAPCDTFFFDPNAPSATAWQTMEITRSVGTCLCCATIAA